MRLLSLLMAALGVSSSEAPAADPVQAVRLTLAGWTEEKPDEGMRFWQDGAGDVLSLAVQDPASARELLGSSSEVGRQRSARRLAESAGGGLIEVARAGPGVRLIYKRLERPAYIYTGMLLMPGREATLVWTIVAGERGETGIREAVVTAELMGAGKLTLDGYRRSWAQDPYDPTYRGVDRSVLRFPSDDERYDERFPQHPLSKVRRVLAALPGSVAGLR